MPDPQGRILPAGSPLVQFEVESEAHGAAKNTRGLIWVDRTPFSDSGWCKPTFRAPSEMDEFGERVGNTFVCLCMGRFVE
jgi:hypothetical protein